MGTLIEDRFPHLIEGLTKNWGKPRYFDDYFQTLVFDGRWDRNGWPEDAWEELQFLQELHRLAYAKPKEADEPVDDTIKWVS